MIEWTPKEALICGLRAIGREQLGSQVVFEGRKCFVSNWAGSEHPTLADGNGFYRQHVPREAIKSVWNLREAWHRFKFGFTHYTWNWMGIDINRRLYPSYFKKESEP